LIEAKARANRIILFYMFICGSEIKRNHKFSAFQYNIINLNN